MVLGNFLVRHLKKWVIHPNRGSPSLFPDTVAPQPMSKVYPLTLWTRGDDIKYTSLLVKTLDGFTYLFSCSISSYPGKKLTLGVLDSVLTSSSFGCQDETCITLGNTKMQRVRERVYKYGKDHRFPCISPRILRLAN